MIASGNKGWFPCSNQCAKYFPEEICGFSGHVSDRQAFAGGGKSRPGGGRRNVDSGCAKRWIPACAGMTILIPSASARKSNLSLRRDGLGGPQTSTSSSRRRPGPSAVRLLSSSLPPTGLHHALVGIPQKANSFKNCRPQKNRRSTSDRPASSQTVSHSLLMIST